jgi:hypothetical protein
LLSTLSNDVIAYKKIQFFMTKEEVVKILGRPSIGKGTDVLEPSIFDFYTTSASAEIRAKGEVWLSPISTIWIVFDAKSRVVGMGLESSRTLRSPPNAVSRSTQFEH